MLRILPTPKAVFCGNTYRISKQNPQEGHCFVNSSHTKFPLPAAVSKSHSSTVFLLPCIKNMQIFELCACVILPLLSHSYQQRQEESSLLFKFSLSQEESILFSSQKCCKKWAQIPIYSFLLLPCVPWRMDESLGNRLDWCCEDQCWVVPKQKSVRDSMFWGTQTTLWKVASGEFRPRQNLDTDVRAGDRDWTDSSGIPQTGIISIFLLTAGSTALALLLGCL